jgi:hypothetical protein
VGLHFAYFGRGDQPRHLRRLLADGKLNPKFGAPDLPIVEPSAMSPARKPAIRRASWNTTEDIVKRTSVRPRAKTFTGGESDSHKQPGHRRVNSSRSKSDPKHDPKDGDSTHDQLPLEQSELERFKELPKEVGVMLVTAGIVGLILPGPGTPALIAGGLALWPKAFGKLESWLERHHPVVHRQSMQQIDRFLNDLEKRYSYSSRD